MDGAGWCIGNTDASPQKQDEYLTFLLQKQLDGFLVVPVQNSSPVLKMLVKREVPLVVLDRRLSLTVDTVRGDSEGGAYELTKHLLDLGHRHIALINGAERISTSQDRMLGYRRAIQEAAPGCTEMVYWGEYKTEVGYDLTRKALAAIPRPTAFFAANNDVCIGVTQALREANLRVLEDISVVAFDDLPLYVTLEPFLP